MTDHTILTYSGRLSLETDSNGQLTMEAENRLHQLLDDAIGAYHGDQVSLETAVVHFERVGAISDDSMPRAHVEISSQGTLAELETVEDTLAQAVVDIGLEPDLETAKAEITVG